MPSDACIKRPQTKTASRIVIYLSEELGDARLRAAQLKRYVQEATDLIEKSPHRDHFFEVAAHLLQGIPEALFKLEKALDAAAMATARLDYEEIKQGLKPEKAEELEAVMEDTRLRYLNRRSTEDTMLTPKDAAAILTHLADRTEAEGRVPVAPMLTLIARLEGADRVASEPTKAVDFFKQAAEALVGTKAPSRHSLASVLRRVLADTIQPTAGAMAAAILAQAGSREDVEEGFKSANPDLTEEDLKKIGDEWEKNKDVVKDKQAAADKDKDADDDKDDDKGKAFPGAAPPFGKDKTAAGSAASALSDLRAALQQAEISIEDKAAAFWKLWKSVSEGNSPGVVRGVEGTIPQVLDTVGDLRRNQQRIGDILRMAWTRTAADKDSEDEDDDDKGKPFPGAAPPFGKDKEASESDKDSRHTEGEPADKDGDGVPDNITDPKDKKDWKANTDEHGDKFKKDAKLMARQEAILKKYLGTGGKAMSFDDLPANVQSELRRVKDQETLESDAERWLGDNNNPHTRSMWAASTGPWKVEAAAELKTKFDPSYQQQLGLMTKNPPKVETVDGMTVIEVFSPFVKKYIPMAEYPTSEDAQKDLGVWMKAHRETLQNLRAAIKTDKAADWKAAADANKDAMYAKGVPADPTEKMTEEQKAEWKKQNEAHKDDFKKGKEASTDPWTERTARSQKVVEDPALGQALGAGRKLLQAIAAMFDGQVTLDELSVGSMNHRDNNTSPLEEDIFWVYPDWQGSVKFPEHAGSIDIHVVGGPENKQAPNENVAYSVWASCMIESKVAHRIAQGALDSVDKSGIGANAIPQVFDHMHKALAGVQDEMRSAMADRTKIKVRLEEAGEMLKNFMGDILTQKVEGGRSAQIGGQVYYDPTYRRPDDVAAKGYVGVDSYNMPTRPSPALLKKVMDAAARIVAQRKQVVFTFSRAKTVGTSWRVDFQLTPA